MNRCCGCVESCSLLFATGWKIEGPYVDRRVINLDYWKF